MMSSFSIPTRRTAAPRRFPWLFASVAINLVFVGLTLSWALGMRSHQPLPAWQSEFMRALSPEDAAVTARAIDRLKDVQTRADKQLGEQYLALKAALLARPYSAADTQKALDQMSFIRDDQQIAFQKIVAEEAAALSPEGRAKLVDMMEREARRWRPPWH